MLRSKCSVVSRVRPIRTHGVKGGSYSRRRARAVRQVDLPMEKVVVQHSPIQGLGVFATRRIEPGEIIIDGCREVLTEEAVKALPTEERIFLAVMDGRNILMIPPARFVNHSCNPNARGTDQHDVAIRVIEAGEEVTVDYVAEQVPGLTLQCNCKAPNCRGLLVVPPASQE
jgi:hypothetical protein